MARGEMLTVFSYDIGANRKRRKAAAILEEAASRVQKSVFETRMSRNRAEAVAQRVAALLDPGDSLRVYRSSPELMRAASVLCSKARMHWHQSSCHSCRSARKPCAKRRR